MIEGELSPAEYLHRMRGSSVYNVARRSPLDRAARLSRELGREVFLKREDLQPTRSFKLRGAYQKISSLSARELAAGVVAASAGNHAQGVALAAKTCGISATIVVPETTPEVKTSAIVELGAELVLHGDSYDDACAYATELALRTDRAFIHPFDDPAIIVGQGTIGLEIADQLDSQIDAIFVPVGGGGLISGVALAIKQVRPGVKVVGVEVDDADALTRSIAAKRRVTLERMGMFADGCAVRTVGETTFAIARDWVDEMVTVTNDQVCAAIQSIYREKGILVEPSGALGLAGLTKWASDHPGDGALVTILSGANMNFDRLQFITERTKLGSKSEAILAIEIPERPGAFLSLCESLGRRSITEFNYRIGDPDRAMVFVGLAVRGASDVEAVHQSLRAAKFDFVDLSDDEIAKLHVRHMVGGRSDAAHDERVFRVEFPERAGCLAEFLGQLDPTWNISLFHYRNHGADRGRALIGFQVPAPGTDAFRAFVATHPYHLVEVTMNPAVHHFLGGLPANVR